MCLILIAFNYHPKYRLVVAANRDEFYERPAAAAGFWQDNPQVLAGRDLQQMGTWLGLNMTGGFAAVTNYRDPFNIKTEARTRGELVRDYLLTALSPAEYLELVRAKREEYNGFNLLVGNNTSLYYYGNTENQIKKLKPGLYGLSNHLLDTPWPKITRGKEMMHRCLTGSREVNVEDLFALLSDEKIAEDKDLPDTGIGLEKERLLSSIFIAGAEYGTRSSTVVLIGSDNHVLFRERTFNGRLKGGECRYEFDLVPG